MKVASKQVAKRLFPKLKFTGDGERAERSQEDAVKYQKSLEGRKDSKDRDREQKNPCRNRIHRAYQAVILEAKDEIVKKINVKAMSKEEAQDKLKEWQSTTSL